MSEEFINNKDGARMQNIVTSLKKGNKKLPNCCRACLKKRNNMMFLLDDTEEVKTLMIKLSSLLDGEVELKSKLPSYLCKICEKKINTYFEFREQCRSSNDLICQYLESHPKIERSNLESHNKDMYKCLHCNESYANKKSLEDHYLLLHSKKCDRKVEHNMDIQESPTSIEEEVPVDFELKTNTASQRMRLKQFAIEDIEKAIKRVREKLYRHVTCMFCQFQAISNRTLSVHVTRVHSGFKGQWCSACNKVFDNLAQHTKEVHYEDLKCAFCDKIQSNMGHFMEHMASHSGTRCHKCTLCNKSFISSRHLKTHQETHIDERSFGCKICTKTFLHSKILRTHVRLAHKRSTAPQNYCQKCNKKVRSLMEHNLRSHGVVVDRVIKEDKQNLCPHCGKRFKTQSKLTVHIRTHTGETPYKCQYCEKKLKTRNILVVHERTHTGEKPYTCTVCGKSFAQSSVLNTHLRIHTGRPEQCNICEKRFCRPAELKLHLRKHTGEKPYSCDVCNHCFKQKSHLVEHVKRHSNSRPYKCNFCEKAFKNIGTLKCHLQIHTGDKPFKCSQCSYACRQPYSLTQHMQQHDNDRPQPNYPHACEICQKSFGTMAHLTTHYNRFHSQLNIKPLDKLEPPLHFAEEFVDQVQPIIINESNHSQVTDSNQPKYDPMFEFTVI